MSAAPDMAGWSAPIAVYGPPDWLSDEQQVMAYCAGRWIDPMRADALNWGDWFTGKGPQITEIRVREDRP